MGVTYPRKRRQQSFKCFNGIISDIYTIFYNKSVTLFKKIREYITVTLFGKLIKTVIGQFFPELFHLTCSLGLI